jgi:hypothetical protein
MTEPLQHLTIDDAMGEFQALLRERYGDAPAGESLPPRTPEQKEAECFRMAEVIVSLICPDPRACIDHSCRRNAVCRHWRYVKMKESSGRSDHPRRTAGAEAVRYAIWAYMSLGQR